MGAGLFSLRPEVLAGIRQQQQGIESQRGWRAHLVAQAPTGGATCGSCCSRYYCSCLPGAG
eukprot:8970963-Pyramimonas_sp.AAC.1